MEQKAPNQKTVKQERFKQRIQKIQNKMKNILGEYIPEAMNEIIKSRDEEKGKLFLGSLEAASNPFNIFKLHIKGVISLTTKEMVSYDEDIVPHHLKIKELDMPDTQLSKYFKQTNEFIQEHIKTGNILVHCNRGVSRSATIVAAYLIFKFKKTTEKALMYVKKRRRQSFPNPAFIEQLMQLEDELNQNKEDDSDQQKEKKKKKKKRKVPKWKIEQEKEKQLKQRIQKIQDEIDNIDTPYSNELMNAIIKSDDKTKGTLFLGSLSCIWD